VYNESTDDVVIQTLVGQEIGQFLLDPLPTKADYLFNGWFYDETFLDPVSPDDVLTENTTIYVLWALNLALTFNLNGGTVAEWGTDPITYATIPGTLIGTVYNYEAPTRAGYVWTSPYWVTTAEGSTDAASSSMVDSDVTVYAYWVEDI
jgi:uncharacterized repeat protein (TIGR02543 family)